MTGADMTLAVFALIVAFCGACFGVMVGLMVGRTRSSEKEQDDD